MTSPGGNTGVPPGSILNGGIPVNPASDGVTNPQYAQINFSQYMPPGVYTQAMPGPQLAVNSSAPTAVGIFGQSIGYQTNVQTVLINPDGTGPLPQVSVAVTTAGSPPVNDVQTVTISGSPTGGNFTLTWNSSTTQNIPYDATAATVLESLETISGLAPTNGANDVQTVTINGAPTGGTFTLTFGTGSSAQTTGTIAYNASAATVQSALDALSNIGGGNVTVSSTNAGGGTSAGGPYTVTFVGGLNFSAQPVLSATYTDLTGGTSPTVSVAHTTTGAAGTPVIAVTGGAGGPYTVTFVGALAAAAQPVFTATNTLSGGTSPNASVAHTVTGAAPVNEVQTITVTATGGQFALIFGSQTTSPIGYNATSATVQGVLSALSTIGQGNVSVSGPAGGPYVVTFIGSLGGQNLATIAPGADTNVIPSPTQTLASQGLNLATLVVSNPNTGVPYVLGNDYSVVTISNGVDAASQAANAGALDTTAADYALYALARIVGGALSPGDYVQVSYQFTNPSFYQPTMFWDYGDVVKAYGAPFNLKTGSIQSELTLAAKFAFLNGAYQVMCVAVKSSAGPGNATVGDYNNALQLLQDQPVAVVVPCSPAQALQPLVQSHVDIQSLNRFERRAIMGMDGSNGIPVPSSQRVTNAQALSDSRCMLVDPATFTFFSPEISQTVTVGGQYIAASLAGLTVAMIAAMPLTRKVLYGWSGVAEFEQTQQKNYESSQGLCVIEQNLRGGQVQVRHGVSTNNADMLSREWSIIGQQDAMAYRLRDYLESANLIGQPIYPYTLTNVKGSAEAALQSLIRDGLIVNYTGLQVRQLATNPDVLEVSYSWLPAFPLNYIVVTFSVSLTTGNLNQTSVGVGGQPANQLNMPQNQLTTLQTNTSGQAEVGSPDSSVANDFGGPSNTLQSV